MVCPYVSNAGKNYNVGGELNPMPEQCKDCGIRITKKQRVSRCKTCQGIRNKQLALRRMHYRLGSPKLYRKLPNGRLIPEDYKCGVNRNREYPQKKQPWMRFTQDNNNTLVDMELILRQQAMHVKQFPTKQSWVRIKLYEWKHDLDNEVPLLTRAIVYRNWEYYKNL